MYGNTGAKAAIEIALHDLVGRATGRPVHALLGGKKRSRMPLLAVIGTGEVARRPARGRREARAGYVAFKIKVGVDKPDADAERTRRICDALGRGLSDLGRRQPGLERRRGRALRARGRRRGLDFFEQPVARTTSPAWRRSPPRAACAIGADEGIHSLDDIARHHERKAARGVSLKAIKLGGLRGVLRRRRAVRPARHERQHLVQDRRIEHRLGGGRAPRRRAAVDRLGR